MKYEFLLEGLDCANCANKIQNKLAENSDYKNVNVNFNTLKLSFESELENVFSEVEKVVKSLEPDVEVVEVKKTKHKKINNLKKNFNVLRLVLGIIFMIVSNFVTDEIVKLVLIISAYVLLLFRTAKNASKLLKNKL